MKRTTWKKGQKTLVRRLESSKYRKSVIIRLGNLASLLVQTRMMRYLSTLHSYSSERNRLHRPWLMPSFSFLSFFLKKNKPWVWNRTWITNSEPREVKEG